MSENASVLIVDDDVDTCENLADILSDSDYHVNVAHDGEAALELAREKPYDVALLDLKMPGMDGLTLYREIKKLQAGTVAIVVTAYASSATAEQILEAGAWQIIPKPIDVTTLLAQVEQVLDQPLVMVVDDDHDLCETLWDLLREKGYRVCLAHDVEAAAERIRNKAHQAVLVDMKLPDGDGRKVLKLVRKTNPQARTLLISGYRDEMSDGIEQALREGAGGVCYKPFDVPQLLQTVQSLVSDRASEQRTESHE